MPAVLDQRLTTSQAARVAGVSDQTIRLWMRSGRLPHERTPLGALIDHAELERFLAMRSAVIGGRGGPTHGHP
jgi:excisionase family DNA binding protein